MIERNISIEEEEERWSRQVLHNTILGTLRDTTEIRDNLTIILK